MFYHHYDIGSLGHFWLVRWSFCSLSVSHKTNLWKCISFSNFQTKYIIILISHIIFVLSQKSSGIMYTLHKIAKVTSWTFVMISSIVLADGHPEYSSSTEVHLFLKCLYHNVHTICEMFVHGIIPEASFIIDWVSAAS